MQETMSDSTEHISLASLDCSRCSPSAERGMKLPKEDKPKLLTREEILNFEEPSKKVELPSGVIVTIKYLAFFAVFEILNSIESKKNKESLFAKKIVKLLLRENEEKDLTSFTREDQIALIRYAAQEWGCKKEFEKLPDSLSPENRFYQAVIDKNNRFQQQMSASIANLNRSSNDLA